jgi:hypothetical protein
MNTCSETQGFGQNANTSYAEGGLQGHTGIDVNCGWDTPIHANYDGVVYKIINDLQPANDGSNYWMIATLCQKGTDGDWHEHSYGHVNKIFVKEGDIVKRGDLIGTEGNHGKVFEGGIEITPAMQKAGDKRGHHRHYQDRYIKREVGTEPHKTYLSGFGQTVYRDKFDYCYLIPNYTNGYNGCVAFPEADIFDLFAPAVEPQVPIEVEKTVEAGLDLAKKLGAYPQFRASAIALLQKLSTWLASFRK